MASASAFQTIGIVIECRVFEDMSEFELLFEDVL